MADWFAELVDKACARVLAETDLGGLAADLKTAGRFTEQVTQLLETGTLLELHAASANAVERLDREREAMLRELLPRQWQAVAAAEDRIRRIEEPLPPPLRSTDRSSMSPVDRLASTMGAAAGIVVGIGWRLLRIAERDLEAKLERFRELAYGDLAQARADFSAAAAQESVVQGRVIQEINARRNDARHALLDELVADLTGRLNLIIDADLTASYQREFSYSGSAWLVDRLGADAERLSAEINGSAFAEIRGKIDGALTGAVGVAGPRGIGKTTLLSQFARPVPDLRPLAPWEGGGLVQRWGVSVAAPAQYDARDFLLHLFGALCASVLGEARVVALESEMTGAGTGPGGARLPYTWFASYLTVIALLCGGVAAGLDTARPVPPRSMTDLLIACCCAVVAVVTASVPRRRVRSWVESTFRHIEQSTGLSFTSKDIGLVGMTGQAYRLVRRAMLTVVAVSAIAAGALLALVLTGFPPDPGYLAAVALAGIAVLALLAFRSRTGLTEFVSIGGDTYSAQIRAAKDWYQKVKFQQSYTTGWSGTVTLSPSALPVQAQASRSSSKAVSQVSMSVPEIVAGFASFTDVLRSGPRRARLREALAPSGAAHGAEIGAAPSPSAQIPVVIGIDEVDKIEDPKTAQAFFNQIKGLFGDANCLFLISISDDAMAAYERRGLPLRDAFDSSLSTVVALSYLTRLEARKLAGSRLVQITEPSADLLYVLSGGLPRELVRLIRRAVDLQRDLAAKAGGQQAPGQHAGDAQAAGQQPEQKPPPVPLDDLAVTLIAEQVGAQRRAVLIRGRALEPCPARDGLLAWAGDPASDAPANDGTVTGRPGDAATSTASNTGTGAASVASSTGVPVAGDYFHRLVTTGLHLLAACDGLVHDPQAASGSRPHADGCAAQETGAFLLWLGTVGQVFGRCHDQEDFKIAERPHDPLSFERLARARQNFPLGPGYVRAAVTAVRSTWHLDPPAADDEANAPAADADDPVEAPTVRAVS